MADFHPIFRNRHLATIAGNFWPRNYRNDPIAETARLFRTEPDVQVLGVETLPRETPAAEAIVLHGLEGSHESGYCISLARTLNLAGYRVLRLNMRTCGGTEQYCKTLYHAGLTSDLSRVIEQWNSGVPLFLIGFSLGGNVVLKFTGEQGAKLRGVVAATVAISTPIDLGACCEHLKRWQNRLYEDRFVRRLRERYLRRCAQLPDRFQPRNVHSIRTVWDFDDQFTAPHFGFGSAPGYYGTQSSRLFLAGVSLPTLLIQAKDDPMIPFPVFERERLERHPHIRLLATEHGGHVGFLSRRPPRFWVDEIVRDWLSAPGNVSSARFV